MSATAEIQLSFLGGASAIGASSALLQVGETSILVDCGVRFKTGNALPDLQQLTGKRLDAIVVTHAHSDHSGALPVVHDAYPDVPIYLTPPTQELISILQRDALQLMDREGDVPLYTERQVESMIARFRPVHHGDRIQVGDIDLMYLPASHILGASMVYLSTPAGHVLFTGDYSVEAQRTVPALTRPTFPVDLLVTETTYGNRLHADRRTSENRLVSRVAQVLEAGGRILIPAFAIGRAQEVLLILKQALRHKQIPPCPIFVDGMVRSVCGVYSHHPRYVSRALWRESSRSGHPFFSDSIVPVANAQARQDVLSAGACVIVASSGMLSGGPSASYAAALARCDRDAILITGYQDEESPGRALLNLAEQSGPRPLRLGDQVVDVRCTFETYSLSAHADRMQMVGLIEALRPRTVVLVHGDTEAKTMLARSLSCRDIVYGEEGVQIARRYPRRRSPILADDMGDMAITPEAAAALIGPATGEPLRAARLAEAWFGKPVAPVLQDHLVQQLEQTGLVRRDDHRRGLLWPLTPVAATPEPSAEERELAEMLKAENPKGKLLEWCMRRRIDTPTLRESTDADGGFVMELELEIEGERVSSGSCRASAKKVAEQLAAKALLDCLSRQEQTVEAIGVSEAQQIALEQQNPKGKLFEFCAQRKLSHPRFQTEAMVEGYRCVVTVKLPGGSGLHTKPFLAVRAKVAEQAAAASLYEQLLTWEQNQPDGPTVSVDRQAGVAASVSTQPDAAPPRPDARVQLNHWRQQQHLVNFGYELMDHHGPSHQPVFVMTAWAELPSGDRHITEPVTAGSKKAAQLAAAAALRALLEADANFGGLWEDFSRG
jgi:Cft2 family RNA processing exonuclease/dsRNA-specific ribonuclease